MSFLKKFVELFSQSPRRDEFSYKVYVKCNVCGEIICSRVNLRNDLSLDYDQNGRAFYFVRKVLIGSQSCFRPIEITLHFNQKRQLLDRVITGGEFTTEEAYLEQHYPTNG